MASYFSSDLHIGHKTIHKYRDIFASAEEHHEYMISKIEKLGKRDVFTIIGDFIFDSPDYDKYMKRINNCKCRIKLVMGNHDSLKLYKEPKIEVQLPLFSYKNKWVSHCPIHPNEMRNRLGNIHGHLHKEVLNSDAYFNVNIDVHNYEFVELDTIKAYFNELADISPDIENKLDTYRKNKK